MKLPKKIYVQIEEEGSDNEYLRAEKTPEQIGEDGKVGIYELKEVKNRRTEIHLD